MGLRFVVAWKIEYASRFYGFYSISVGWLVDSIGLDRAHVLMHFLHHHIELLL